MSLSTINVIGTLIGADEQPISGATVTATITSDRTDGLALYTAAKSVSTTTAPDGTWTLAVVPNDAVLLPSGTSWKFTIQQPPYTLFSKYVVITESMSPSVELMSLVPLNEPPEVGGTYVTQVVAGNNVQVSGNGTGIVTLNASTAAMQSGDTIAGATPSTLLGVDNNSKLVSAVETASVASATSGGAPAVYNLGTDAYGNLALGAPLSALEPGTTGSGNSGNGNTTALGLGALAAETTPNGEVAIGYKALAAITNGKTNIAIGYEAMGSASGGAANVAIGFQALNALEGTFVGPPYPGSYNTAIGDSAGQSLTTGYTNTFIGSAAGQHITTGQHNIAIGDSALWAQSGGAAAAVIENIAIGGSALQAIQTNANVAIGQSALQLATTGTNLVAVGRNALGVATTATGCTAVGAGAGVSVTTAQDATLVGVNSGFGLTTGNEMTSVGLNAGRSIVASANCTTIGSHAGYTSTTDSANMTLLGYGTIGTGAGAVAIGIDSGGTSASAGTNQFSLGTANHQVKISNNTTGSGSAALGSNCPAVTVTAPYTWMKMMSSDGSTVYVPCWK